MGIYFDRKCKGVVVEKNSTLFFSFFMLVLLLCAHSHAEKHPVDRLT